MLFRLRRLPQRFSNVFTGQAQHAFYFSIDSICGILLQIVCLIMFVKYMKPVGIFATCTDFFSKDIYLGELMSTVCSVHVRGWAGVGACSAEGVGDGPDPAGGRLGHHSRRSGFSSAFSYFEPCPRKPVKQHNGCVYWLTRDVAVGLAR